MNELQLNREAKAHKSNQDISKIRELPLELQIILYLQMLGFIRVRKSFRYLFEAITYALDGMNIDKNLWDTLAKQHKVKPHSLRSTLGIAIKGAHERKIEQWNDWLGADILSLPPRDKYFVEASVDWILSHKIVDKIHGDKFIGYKIILTL